MLKAFIFLLVSTSAIGGTYEWSIARRVEREIRSGHTPITVNKALDGLINKAEKELRAKGFEMDAVEIDYEWQTTYSGMVLQAFDDETYAIGDHAPLFQWLAKLYDKLEAKLGRPLCVALHFSDLKTFNYCIPVVFRPCKFPMDAVQGARKDEYRRHFDTDGVYPGLLPVVVFWIIEGACSASTAGAGVLICGVAANLGERLMMNWIGGPLSDWTYTKACGT